MITMLILDTLSCLGRYCILISQNIPDETLHQTWSITNFSEINEEYHYLRHLLAYRGIKNI